MEWKIPEQKPQEYKDAHAAKHINNIIVNGKCECGRKGLFLGEPFLVRTKVLLPKDFN